MQLSPRDKDDPTRGCACQTHGQTHWGAVRPILVCGLWGAWMAGHIWGGEKRP